MSRIVREGSRPLGPWQRAAVLSRDPCSCHAHAVHVNGRRYRTIWRHPDRRDIVRAIDQRALPFEFSIVDITSTAEMAAAITDMTVRGAGLIGAAAGYGMALAAAEASRCPPQERAGRLAESAAELVASRPTAVNLSWAVERQLDALEEVAATDELVARAWREAEAIADDDAEWCRRIGQHGLPLIEEIHERTGTTVNVLTHCNAGWLAFVDHGTATSPIYAAHDAGIPVHVWVDETRPRNQGSRLTAWELGQHGVPHTVIVDNAGGHLMQHGLVDIVLTGSDRVTRNGDVANKIGTYLKALAASDNAIPFHVALPSSTIDWSSSDGPGDTPIEERDPREVTHVEGLTESGVQEVQVTPMGTPARNHAFDVTPARLVTGLVTERGRCPATAEGIASLFGDDPRRADAGRAGGTASY